MTGLRSSRGAGIRRPALFCLVVLCACAGGDSSRRPLVDVLAEVSPGLMELPGVVLVYESRLDSGEPCIKVGVAEDTPELREEIGEVIEGYPVVVVETGPIQPRSKP